MKLLMTLLKCVSGMVSSPFIGTLISPLFGIRGPYMEPKVGVRRGTALLGAKSGHPLR